MLNLTSRLAIKLRYLPDWEFDWSDNSPQCSSDSLTLEVFLLDEEDAAEFTQLAVEYTMCFLVKDFPTRHTLRNTLSELQPLHPVMKTAVPQKVLFKDEKYIHETIAILFQLIDDANLQGDPQVQLAVYNNRIEYDQLYCVHVHVYDNILIKAHTSVLHVLLTCTCTYAHILKGYYRRSNDMQKYQGWKAMVSI